MTTHLLEHPVRLRPASEGTGTDDPPVTDRRSRRSRLVPGFARRVHHRTPLRVRLVGGLLLMVVAALIGSGIAASTVMRSYLVGRVDQQLRAVSASNLVGLDTDADGDGRGGSGHKGGGRLPTAYVIELLGPTGTVVDGPSSEQVSATDPLPRLPTVTGTRSAADGARTVTVPAVSGDESWRVLIEPVTLTDGTTGTLLIAQSLGDVDGTVERLELLMLVIGGVAVVLLAAGGYLVVRTSLRPLRDVERTAAAIAAGDLTRRVPHADERTEVGSLSGSLNTMLGEIESAFAARAASEQAARASEDRMRRFVADAGHELRTPLTTIRGFAELYRQGAAPDPSDVGRLMTRIEGEASRMGLLVEDLLMLARLDRQRPLRHEPVDLLALASDAVSDARAVCPDRAIALELGRTDPPPVVLGDEPRLRQVLANLLGNAARHTPRGTPVTVALGTANDTVTLSVIDRGPGMTPADAARIFERFYRVDDARNRDDGGSGLGLSIVAALVAGHGGRVTVDTAPGQGATFHVELPLAVPAAGS